DIMQAVWGHSVDESSVHKRTQNLRQFFGDTQDDYITRHKSPVRLKIEPIPLPSWYNPDLLSTAERPRLTPRDPKDDPPARRLWLNEMSHPHNRALHDPEFAWIMPFAERRIRDFSLTYNKDASSYADLMPPLALSALEWWRKDQTEKGKAAQVDRLENERLGFQVRLVGMRFAHNLQRYHIDLAPAKFLHYVAIQQNLWAEELHNLRQHAFENALRGISEESPLMLPCTFAIHMVAISSDQKAILRQRDHTPIYPLAWEAGPGELMHGPEYAKAEFLHHGDTDEDFPHFNERGEPDLFLYLRNTIKEELNYPNAADDDFRIYGLAIEWRTLAPKLIVVYQSDASKDVLVKCAKDTPEQARAISHIDLSVDGISKAFTNGQYPWWGPTSKVALLLALMQSGGEHLIYEVQARMDELDPLCSRLAST
ncbi:MAG: hypothetical protein WCC37_19200, partial [Candidatus Sulfotelmatobacter sp.]